MSCCSRPWADLSRPSNSTRSGRYSRTSLRKLKNSPRSKHRRLVRRPRRHRPQLSRQGRMVDGRGRAYENWINTRKQPLFGTEPDARVRALTNQASDPTAYRVLDIGRGTGRNALALARGGDPVDVVEMTPKFAGMIRADAERESL